MAVFRKTKRILYSPIDCVYVTFSTNKALQDQWLAILWTSISFIWHEREKRVYCSFKIIPQHPAQRFTHSNYSVNTCWKETWIPKVCACSITQLRHRVNLTISPYAQTSHSVPCAYKEVSSRITDRGTDTSDREVVTPPQFPLVTW